MLKRAMLKKATLWLTLTLSSLALSALLEMHSSAQGRVAGGSGREVYTGTIVYIPGPTVGGPGRTQTTTQTFTLRINCITPDSEYNRLAGILKDGGQDGLLREISKEKCGIIQFGSSVGRDINTVHVETTEEGERKITLLFERWLRFGEVRYGTRSRDYPFTYIEMFVDRKGKAEGTMIPAARVRFKGQNTIEIENFAAYPARLTATLRRR